MPGSASGSRASTLRIRGSTDSRWTTWPAVDEWLVRVESLLVWTIDLVVIADDCVRFCFGYDSDCWWLFIILTWLWLLMILYASDLVLIVAHCLYFWLGSACWWLFTIKIWVWLLLIVFHSALAMITDDCSWFWFASDCWWCFNDSDLAMIADDGVNFDLVLLLGDCL